MTVVYVHVLRHPTYLRQAIRFVTSYLDNPPGYRHETLVVCNGARIDAGTRELFRPMPGLSLMQHDNSGYDIGGFQHAARDCKSDLIVFFGASSYFNGRDWLDRMVTAFFAHGAAQYGAMGNRGDPRCGVWPHIRTTAFWMPPRLMNLYPRAIVSPAERHPFEHGPDCFTGWLNGQGVPSWVITWGRDLPWDEWDNDPEGYARGSQKALIAGDRMTEPPFYPRR